MKKKVKKKKVKMKRIPIRNKQGRVKKWIIVDSEDYQVLSQKSWFAIKSGNTYYACRRTLNSEGMGNRAVLMHRIINKTPRHLVVDHINGNGLDNRRKNLRNCTIGDNQNNRRINKNNTSGFPHVLWREVNKRKWIAERRVGGKYYYLGAFAKKRDAIKAAKDFQKLHNLPS